MYLWSRGGIVFLEKVGFQNALSSIFFVWALRASNLCKNLRRAEAKDPNTSPCGSLLTLVEA